MFVRFKETVEVGLRKYKQGDIAELDDNTARSLIDLKVAAKAPGADRFGMPLVHLSSGGDIPQWTDEDKARLDAAMFLVKTPRAGREPVDGDTLPAPETKKKGGLFRRTRS